MPKPNLTRTERVNALLARIFVVSCLAASRDDWDNVARLDDRYDRIDHHHFGTPIGV